MPFKTGSKDEIEQITFVGKEVQNPLPSGFDYLFAFRPRNRPDCESPDRCIGQPLQQSHLLFFPLECLLTDHAYPPGSPTPRANGGLAPSVVEGLPRTLSRGLAPSVMELPYRPDRALELVREF